MTDDFETLFDNYQKELTDALERANARYQVLAMSEKYNDLDLGLTYDTIWPAELGGDPVVLRVIRDYFMKCSVLIERRLAIADVDSDEDPATPADFLFLTLEERDEEMSYEIRLARFMPIGFEDAAYIAKEAGIDGN